MRTIRNLSFGCMVVLFLVTQAATPRAELGLCNPPAGQQFDYSASVWNYGSCSEYSEVEAECDAACLLCFEMDNGAVDRCYNFSEPEQFWGALCECSDEPFEI